MGLLAATPTLPDLAIFALGALMVLAGALGVIAWRNPVHAALSLVLTLFGIAVLFVEQQADFLAAVQIIVYAGAIVVLFLFVIMFLGVDRTEDVATEPLAGQRPLAVLLVVIMVGSILALSAESHWVTGASSVVAPTSNSFWNVNQLGRVVFSNYLFAFEVTAALLIVAVVGAVVLARRSGAATSEEAMPTLEPEAWDVDVEEVDR
jgi:NADH-quinone oxidoreductase subunit J